MKYVSQSIVFRDDFTSFHLMQRITYIYLIFSLLCPISILAETAKGVVFLDANENGIKDSHEKGLSKVCVSNGLQVVQTDKEGRYQIEVESDSEVFVIKPRDYMTSISADMLPQFYYVYKPQGSNPGLKVKGLSPTGPLPRSIDFPLYHNPEPESFRVLVFGDPQPGNPEEIGHMAHDVIENLIGIGKRVDSPAFGVSLGDLGDPRYSSLYNQVIAKIGLPWYNILGNHDVHEQDEAAKTDAESDDCFQRVYGPANYSFNYGPVHFIALDNCTSVWNDASQSSTYFADFNPHVLQFVESDLKFVPMDKLVVLMFHIPLVEGNRDDLLKLLEGRPNTLSLSGHYHEIIQWFMERGGGNPEHHHITCGALCGIHWLGPPNMFGIPASTMHCGSPNGHLMLHIQDSQYKLTFHGARTPKDHQMHIWTPEKVSKLDIGQSEVVANVFMGNERSRIRMSIDGKDDWIDMKREARKDPYLVDRLPSGHAASESKHIWVARLPSDIKPGVHTVRVRSEDMYGQFFEDQRIFRVVSDIPLKPSDVNPNDKPIPGVNPGDSGNLVWTGGSDHWEKIFSEILSSEVELSINTPVEVILSSHTRIGALQVSENGVLSVAEGGNLWVKGKPFYIGSGYQQNAVGAGKVHLSQTGICTIESNVVFGDRENSPGTLIASGQSRVNILGGHYLGVRSNGKIIIRNQAVYNVAGKIQFGWGADLGFKPSTEIILDGGTLITDGFTVTINSKPRLLFHAGTMLLHGDQRKIVEESWCEISSIQKLTTEYSKQLNQTRFHLDPYLKAEGK